MTEAKQTTLMRLFGGITTGCQLVHTNHFYVGLDVHQDGNDEMTSWRCIDTHGNDLLWMVRMFDERVMATIMGCDIEDLDEVLIPEIFPCKGGSWEAMAVSSLFLSALNDFEGEAGMRSLHENLEPTREES